MVIESRCMAIYEILDSLAIPKVARKIYPYLEGLQAKWHLQFVVQPVICDFALFSGRIWKLHSESDGHLGFCSLQIPALS